MNHIQIIYMLEDVHEGEDEEEEGFDQIHDFTVSSLLDDSSFSVSNHLATASSQPAPPSTLAAASSTLTADSSSQPVASSTLASASSSLPAPSSALATGPPPSLLHLLALPTSLLPSTHWLLPPLHNQVPQHLLMSLW